MTMRKVLVVKLGSTLPEIREAAGPEVEVTQVDEIDDALEQLGGASLVLLSGVTFRSRVGGFLALLRQRALGKQLPVVVIDLMDAGKELSVYEREATGSAPARSAPLSELRAEIARHCAPVEPCIPAGTSTHISISPGSAELRRIGFNDCIQREARAVHVQTEVLGGSPLKVRSTVMEGGGILDATTRSVDIAELQIDKVRDLVRSQHDSVVAEVRRGRYG